MFNRTIFVTIAFCLTIIGSSGCAITKESPSVSNSAIAASNTTQQILSSDRTSIYIEGGFQFGGDKLSGQKEPSCIPPGCATNLRLGSGGHVAVGFQNFIGDNKSESLSLALGYLWEAGTGNFDEKASAVTLEAIYAQHHDLHRLGIGLSYHHDPRYEEEISDLKKIKLDFDDSLGVVFKYGYFFRQADWHLGASYTIMDYKIGSEDVDASGLGVFVSKSFQ